MTESRPASVHPDPVADWRQWFPGWPVTANGLEEFRPDTFAAALAELVRTLQLEIINDDLHALKVITQGAVGMIAGAEQAGIVVPAGPGLPDSRSAVGELPLLATQLQNQIGEGPCLHAVTQPEQVLITDLRTVPEAGPCLPAHQHQAARHLQTVRRD